MIDDRGQEPGPSAVIRDFMLFAIRSRRLSDTMQRAVDMVAAELGVPTCALVEIVAPRHAVVVQVWGVTAPEVGALVTADDSTLSAPVLRRPIAAEGRSALSVRLVAGEGVWGRLLVADDRVREFGRDDEEVLRMVAAVLSAALERDRVRPVALCGGPDSEPAQTDHAAPSGGRLVTEVALLDADGMIVWVNQAWRSFCRNNGGDLDSCGVGVSYLGVCAAAGDPLSVEVATAIRAAISGELPAPMRVVLPCHSPHTDRWFDVLVSSRLSDQGTCLGATVTLSLIP